MGIAKPRGQWITLMRDHHEQRLRTQISRMLLLPFVRVTPGLVPDSNILGAQPLPESQRISNCHKCLDRWAARLETTVGAGSRSIFARVKGMMVSSIPAAGMTRRGWCWCLL
jgi:hypothetical protein